MCLKSSRSLVFPSFVCIVQCCLYPPIVILFGVGTNSSYVEVLVLETRDIMCRLPNEPLTTINRAFFPWLILLFTCSRPSNGGEKCLGRDIGHYKICNYQV